METEAATGGDLLERDGELRRLRRVLDAAARDEGSVSVLAAPAGLGKTALLEATVTEAAAAGVRPLVARAGELEREYAFGVVRQLVEPAIAAAAEEERARLLAGAARHAAAVLDLDPDAAPDRDVHATLHGLHWLLLNLAAGGPLLVAVDDLQWTDEPSLRWLAYLARRLEGAPIAIVGTLRLEPTGGATDRGGAIGGGAPPSADGAAGHDAASDDARRAALDELLDGARVQRIEPPPLSVDAVAAILERALGRAAEPAFATACHAHTDGNPFLLSEVVAELVADGVAPTAARVGALAQTVPDRVGETLRRHLARLSPEARALAEAVALLGEGDDLPVAADLAGMERAQAAVIAAELVDAQVLAEPSPPRFRHPLLRAAIAAGVPAAERAARHARAARLLAARGAPTARIATQLAATAPGGGDPWAVEQLRAAARSARSQGVPERAAALLRRALAEPPEPGLRAAVLRELGATELTQLDDAATAHLREALSQEEDPRERAGIAAGLGLAHYLAGRHEAAVDDLLAGIADAERHGELREQRLHLESVLALAGRYDLRTETRVRGRIAHLAEGLDGATPGERLVIAMAASQHPAETAAELAESTELTLMSLDRILPWSDPTAGIGEAAMLLHAGRPDRAAAVVERMLALAGEQGSQIRHAMALGMRGVVALDVGDLRAAEAELATSMEMLAELRADRMARSMVGFYANALVERGSLGRTEAALNEHGLADDVPEQMVFNPLLFQRGQLRLAQRRFADAEADFRELGRRHEQWGMRRPTPPWRSACGLALIAQGRLAEARELAAAELPLVRRWDTPKSIAYTTRALALAAEESDHDTRIDGLAEAVELLDGTPWRLDRARACVDLGAALRRAGRRRDGREALARGMDEAHACGAEPLAERAAEELRASGARPRRRAISGLDALTPSERRVAALAAAGRTNREIAQELFVTLPTVETHLTRVYRKLDLAGRDGLPAALSAPAEPSP